MKQFSKMALGQVRIWSFCLLGGGLGVVVGEGG
jgi:hypothetical protein